MDNRTAFTRRLRAAVSLLLVALYAAGLIAMLASSVQLGLILWVISTLGGAGLLYWLRTKEKEREAAQEADEGAQSKSQSGD